LNKNYAMDSLKVRLILSVIGFALISGAVIGAVLYYLLPQFYPAFFFLIVGFFAVVESAVVWYVAGRASKATSGKMVNVYMLSKVVKILVSLVFITIYAIAVKEGIKNFVLVFVVFYALFLFFETFLFSRIERILKSKKI